MSGEQEKTGRNRLWSAGAPRERNEDKVIPLAKAGAAGDRSYVAFEIRANVSRLRIHRATQPSRFPNYNYLLDIVYDHDFQTVFTLIYSFMTVEVRGNNLDPVVHAISSGSCESIHEYHRNLYDKPADTEPLIEGITVTVPGSEDGGP